MSLPQSPTVVDVKSAWQSKINVAQVAGVVSSIAAMRGLNIPADTIVEVIVAIQTIQSVATIIIRTFFTKTVTPSVAKSL